MPQLSLQRDSATFAEQLASTTAELADLKAKQQELESKNALLEKCLHLNISQRLHQVDSEVMYSHGARSSHGRHVNIAST